MNYICHKIPVRMGLVPYLLAVAIFVSLPACTSTEIIDANSTPALQAQGEIAEALLLDVGITEFDPGLPATEEEMTAQGIVPDVRRAESRFIAYHLKDTLELTGNWGAVRVAPEDLLAADLHLKGRILLSDGEMLKVRVSATDSAGRIWIDKDYEDIASKLSYKNRLNEDPFQDIYNKIANDLLAKRQSRSDEELHTLRTISAIKFARSLSPYAFADYIEESRRGKIVISKLPAPDDPMYTRIQSIKEREYLFIDTLDELYAAFYREMEKPYDDWRRYTYEEAVNLRAVQGEATKRGILAGVMVVGGVIAGSKANSSAGSAAATASVLGGLALGKTAFDKYRESEIHKEALKELSQSMGSEISPIIMNIEGRTIELTGTLDTQYEQWRRILKEIYAEETGLAVE